MVSYNTGTLLSIDAPTRPLLGHRRPLRSRLGLPEGCMNHNLYCIPAWNRVGTFQKEFLERTDLH